MGLFLTYVTSSCVFVFFLLVIRRRGPLRPPQHLADYSILASCVVFVVVATFNLEGCQRPLELFRTSLAQQWLPRTDMRNADARLTNLRGPISCWPTSEGPSSRGANFQEAESSGGPTSKKPTSGATSFFTRSRPPGGAPPVKRSLWGQKSHPRAGEYSLRQRAHATPKGTDKACPLPCKAIRTSKTVASF